MFAILLAAAALAASPPLRLSDLLKEAHAHNPRLQAAQALAGAAEAQVSPAGALDDPKLMVQLWNVPIDFRSVPIMAQLSEKLPLGDKRGFREDAARYYSYAARHRAVATADQIDRDIEKQYFDLYLATQTDAIDAGLAKTLTLLEQAALARVQVGTGEQASVLRAQAAQVQLQAEREVAEQNAGSARVQIAALLDRPNQTVQGDPSSPSLLAQLPPLKKLLALALQHRPEIAAANDTIDAARAKTKLARAQRIPDLGISLAEMHAFGGTGQTDFIYAGLQVNLPIFGSSKNAPRIQEAQDREMAAEADRRALQAQIAAGVADAYAKTQSETRLVKLHHTLIPLAREALQSALHVYATGKGDFSSVIDALHELQMHEIALAEHLSAYEQHLADLQRAVGTNLGLVAATEQGGAHAQH